MQTTYEVYVQWCAEHGHSIPDRELFYRAIESLPYYTTTNLKQTLDALEIAREAREGWIK
jgi:hypothetical protein